MRIFIMHAMKLLCFPIFIFFFSRFQLTCSSSPLYSSQDTTLCPGDQKLALLQFKNTFSTSQNLYEDCNEEDKASYPKTDSWKEDVDCCLWDGVTCEDETGNLIGLDLSCSWLYVTIHSNSSLFNLSHLQRLNLAYNNFRESQISPKFGRFSNLTHLNLSTSSFSGNMPLDLSHLTKLVSVDLSRNYFLGLNTSVYKALARNLTQLRELSLFFVGMTLIDPSLLMNLSSSLTYLNLGRTAIQGNFPAAYFLNLPNFQHLDLRENSGLTGSLPESNWTTSLKYLDLSFCQFTGLLPMAMGNLPQITQINIQSNNFSGKIPASISNLAKLEFLILEENDFRGQIPDAFENLNQLIYVSLGRNRLTGQLPSSIFNLAQLSKIDFSFNQLAGPFPEYASGLPKLGTLDLSSNLLNGTIPLWLLSLPSLQHLNLKDNLLTCNISETKSFSLQTIDLTNNKLQGPIPRFIFQLENLASLMLSSNNLSGVVEIGMFSKLKNLQFLELSSNGLLSLNTSNHFNFTLPSVTYLNLSFCNIKEFPPVLKAFANIEKLDLSNNKIHGQVPHWFYDIGKESLEYLILSNNYLTKIHQFPWDRIAHLDLHGNLLEGKLPIPPFHATFFSVSRNKLTGEVSSSICHLEQLQVLDLSYNNLSGKIPNCLGDFSYELSVLNLRMNRFEGSIPESFQTTLRSLNLNGNQFEGSLPRSLLNCSMLEVLDVGNNKLHDRFPYWLETLPELQVLVLRSNNFHGFVGGFKTSNIFPILKIFDISNNNFTGPFPTAYIKSFNAMMNVHESKGTDRQYIGEEDSCYSDSVVLTIKGLEVEYVKILTIFTTIDLSDNEFQGTIPKEIGELKYLKSLNLSHNNFINQIPASIGLLENLEGLDLCSNNLSGEIPKELTSLTYLAFLNLSWNRLSGPIPQGKQFNTFENDSFEGNLGLCGFPLTRKFNDDDEGSEPLAWTSFQQEEKMEHESLFNWHAIPFGYACGIVYGMVMGYFLLFRGRRR